MAKISILEAVHVSIVIDGEAINRDLVAGDQNIEQEIADVLIAQGLATDAKASGSKKTSAADVAAEKTLTPSEGLESN